MEAPEDEATLGIGGSVGGREEDLGTEADVSGGGEFILEVEEATGGSGEGDRERSADLSGALAWPG